MDLIRKTRSRLTLINLSAVGPGDKSATAGPSQEVIGLGLGHRVLISEQAEVWTVTGHLVDGTLAKDDVGELSLVLIPGDQQPATSVTGFIAPTPPYVLGMSQAKVHEGLRALLAQLGYDRDGYYLSVSIGGTYLYDESFQKL